MTKKKRDKFGQPDFWVFARSFLHVELPFVRKASEKTIEAYRIALESYLVFLDKQKNIRYERVTFDSFDNACIKEFVRWMNEEKGYAPTTVNLRLAALKSFLSFAAQEDIALVALSNAAKTVKGPKVPKQPIKYLSLEETSLLLAAPDCSSASGRRNQMILIMLYDTGARVSELVGISVSDLHLESPAFVSVLGKGNKPRNVPLMKKTVEHLSRYLKEFHPGFPGQRSSDPLFYSNRKGSREGLSTDTVASVLAKYASKVQLVCPDMPDSVTCHTIRKTRAMSLHREGIPLPIIMRFLGHENMSTTSTFYAFATMDMVVEAIESTSSLESLEPKIWKSKAARNVIYSLK